VTLLTTSFRISYLATTAKAMLLVLVLALGFTVYSEWGIFVLTAIEWQKSLHEMLASHISAVSQDIFTYGGALIALSFAYGVFHAVGPGHGKAVIVTYLGTNKESVRKGIFISFTAAILQSVVAITLVSALAGVLKFKLAEVHNYGNDMALVSYILVTLLGFMLVVSSVRRMIKINRPIKKSNISDYSGHINSHEHHGHHHHAGSHGSECGCSHAHVPEQNESIWQTVTVILSMGFRPCSGAIVVLIYAHLVDVYSYGVVATLMMGIGTGLSVSLIAIAILYARSWLERFINSFEQGDGRLQNIVSQYFSHYVRLIGGVILIILGWRFYSVASVVSAGHPLF